jgi:divalent metal cation (Fe/Co/Zn/Cd) transporter
MHRSASGLMDVSLPQGEIEKVEAILRSYGDKGIQYHALRTRQAGRRSFISLHVLVPGKWTVQEAHDWADRIEKDIRGAMPYSHTTTHLEPVDDPCSMDDEGLDRK